MKTFSILQRGKTVPFTVEADCLSIRDDPPVALLERSVNEDAKRDDSEAKILDRDIYITIACFPLDTVTYIVESDKFKAGPKPKPEG